MIEITSAKVDPKRETADSSIVLLSMKYMRWNVCQGIEVFRSDSGGNDLGLEKIWTLGTSLFRDEGSEK